MENLAITARKSNRGATITPGPETTLGPDDAGGVSINLVPPTTVPDLRFQETWHQDPSDKPQKKPGFDDDKPI